jgi:hypothetical protein
MGRLLPVLVAFPVAFLATHASDLPPPGWVAACPPQPAAKAGSFFGHWDVWALGISHLRRVFHPIFHFPSCIFYLIHAPNLSPKASIT